MVDLTLRPSGASPPRVAGSYVQWTSIDLAGGGILDDGGTADQVGVTQADLVAGEQAEILGRRGLAEVILFDVHTFEKGTWRVPALSSSGLLTASIYSTWSSG